MKTLKFTLIFASLLFVSIAVQAQKIEQDSIKKLMIHKEYLKIATEINDLKIKLANEVNTGVSLQDDITNAMRKAESTASTSKTLAVKSDVSSDRSIKKAANAAEKAAKSAKEVQSLNDKLNKSNKKVDGYKADINKLEVKIKNYL
jgi:chromosome segregation ATPase